MKKITKTIILTAWLIWIYLLSWCSTNNNTSNQHSITQQNQIEQAKEQMGQTKEQMEQTKNQVEQNQVNVKNEVTNKLNNLNNQTIDKEKVDNWMKEVNKILDEVLNEYLTWN